MHGNGLVERANGSGRGGRCGHTFAIHLASSMEQLTQRTGERVTEEGCITLENQTRAAAIKKDAYTHSASGHTTMHV